MEGEERPQYCSCDAAKISQRWRFLNVCEIGIVVSIIGNISIRSVNLQHVLFLFVILSYSFLDEAYVYVTL